MSRVASRGKAIHIDCIAAPNDGLNPAVILTVEGAPLTSQYVFHVPEAVSRFCLEHRLRPGLGLRGVFVTGTGHELHGLPGLLMRLRGDGHGAFELFGPGPMEQYVRAMPSVCSWKAPAVLVNGTLGVTGSQVKGRARLRYEDEQVRVWPIWDNDADNNSDQHVRDSDEFMGPSTMNRADVLEQLRSLAPPRAVSRHAVFGRSYRKCEDVTYGDVWTREECEAKDTVGCQEDMLGYACYVKGADKVVIVSGYADDVANRLEVLRRHWLVDGCVRRWKDANDKVRGEGGAPVTIIVPGGGVVTGAHGDEGQVIRVIPLPLVGEHTNNDGILGFDSTAKTAARLHVLCPHAFPSPHAWMHLREDARMDAADRRPPSGAFRMTLSAAETEATYLPYASEGRISSRLELHEQCKKVTEFLEGMEDEEEEELIELREKIRAGSVGNGMVRTVRASVSGDRHGSMPATNQSAAAVLRQRLRSSSPAVVEVISPTSAGENKRKRSDEQYTPIQRDTYGKSYGETTTASHLTAPYVLFLGTGSAEPSKYRGPSGILVKIPYMDDDYMLLECGEGTFGQLVRMFGYSGAMERLAKLRCVWISHRHADHVTGLVELLSRRAACDSSAVVEPELLILGPRACVRWLLSLRPVVKLGGIRVEPLGAANDSTACRHMQQRISAKMTCTPVRHCHDAFAVSFVFGVLGNGSRHETFKLVYSGDTEPCEDLVRIGQGASLFIHEATFESEMVRDARSKRHSTVKEALEVTRRAGAETTVLTHFSQRYPKFPKLEEYELERGGIAVAFDGFAMALEAKDSVCKLTGFLRDFFDG